MRKLYTYFLKFVIIIFAFISLSGFASAADLDPLKGACDNASEAAKSSGVCTSYSSTNSTDASLYGVDGLVGTLLDYLTYFIGFFAIIYAILGIIKITTSNGNDKKLASGKAQVTQAMIGLAVVIIAPLIIRTAIKLAS